MFIQSLDQDSNKLDLLSDLAKIHGNPTTAQHVDIDNKIPLVSVYGPKSFIAAFLSPTELNSEARIWPAQSVPMHFRSYFGKRKELPAYRFRSLTYELESALGTIGVSITHPSRTSNDKWQKLFTRVT